MKKILSLFVFFLFISNALTAQESNQDAAKPACKAKTEAVKECNHSAEQKAACKTQASDASEASAAKPACKGTAGQAMSSEEAKPACKTEGKASCKGNAESGTNCKSKEMDKKAMRKAKKSKKSC